MQYHTAVVTKKSVFKAYSAEVNVYSHQVHQKQALSKQSVTYLLLTKVVKSKTIAELFPPTHVCLKPCILLPSTRVQFATTLPVVNVATATLNYTFQSIQCFPKVKLSSLQKRLK